MAQLMAQQGGLPVRTGSSGAGNLLIGGGSEKLVGLFSLSFALLPVLVGIPLLLFSLSAIRAFATLDYRVHAAILDMPPERGTDDLILRGANFGERLGLLLGSGRTWRSAMYLIMRFVVSWFTLSLSLLILPLLFIEVLILAPLTIDLRLASVRLLRWLAFGAHHISSVWLPMDKPGKRKNDENARLERLRRGDAGDSEDDDADEDEPRYILTDDGEIVMKRG